MRIGGKLYGKLCDDRIAVEPNDAASRERQRLTMWARLVAAALAAVVLGWAVSAGGVWAVVGFALGLTCATIFWGIVLDAGFEYDDTPEFILPPDGRAYRRRRDEW